MKKRWLKGFLLCCALLLAAASFAGCGPSPSPGAPMGEEEEEEKAAWQDPDASVESEEPQSSAEKDGAGGENGDEQGAAPAEEAGGSGGQAGGERAAEKENDGEAAAGAAGNGQEETAVDGQEEPSAEQEEAAAEKAAEPGEKKKPGKDTVFLTIEGPSDVGTVLHEAEVELEEGDTVLDVLQRITRQERIQMEYRGRGSTAYVEGIDNIYEFDHGPESGWFYSVNGYFPSRSSGAWALEAGDRVEWFYSKEMGRDLGVAPGN